MQLTNREEKNPIESVQIYLLNKQKQIREQIESLNHFDPLLEDAVPEVAESGVSVWQAEAHESNQAIVQELAKMSETIKKALEKIKNGTYGICEKCHQGIAYERLAALPIAQACLSCS